MIICIIDEEILQSKTYDFKLNILIYFQNYSIDNSYVFISLRKSFV